MAHPPDQGDWALRCLTALPQAVVVLGPDARSVKWANAAAVDLFGLRAEEVGQSIDTALPAAHRETLGPILDQARQEGRADAWWSRLDEGRPAGWRLTVQAHEHGLLLTAQDLAAWWTQVQQAQDQQAQRRERLVREIHHRLKNSLQGVSGLLLRTADAYPSARVGVEAAVMHIRILTEVHDLQLRQGARPTVSDLLGAVVRVIDTGRGPPIQVSTAPTEPASAPPGPHESPGDWRGLLWSHLDPAAPAAAATPTWRVLESDAPSWGLGWAELLLGMRAHGRGQALQVRVQADGVGVELAMRTPGRWPEGFDPDGLEPGLEGLGLAKALLPRRGARLAFAQEGEELCARLHIRPPAVVDTTDPGPQSGW